MSDGSSTAELEAYLHEQIPVSRLMGIRVVVCDQERVVLSAPLELNSNHLGTAFGGSLATLATLTGYVGLWTALGDRDAHVVVRRSEVDYRRPVRKVIEASCELPVLKEDFRRAFERKGKARMVLPVAIREDGVECVSFCGEFVAIRAPREGDSFE